MPRHKSLIPLSQEHHHTLVLALRLKKGGPTTTKDHWPTDLAEQIERTIEYCTREILPHFALEERTIFLKAAQLESARQLIEALVKDHAEIRSIIGALPELPDATPAFASERLRELGDRLETHIRKEERELFPMLEHAFNAGEITSVA